MADKIKQHREKAEKAALRYAGVLVEDEERKAKRRNGRLLKIGVATVKRIMTGDVAMLDWLEGAVEKDFSTRAIDRQDFELDAPQTWIDGVREELLETQGVEGTVSARGAQPQPSGPPRTRVSQVATSVTAAGSTTAPAPAPSRAHPQAAGANATSGAQPNGAPSSPSA